MSAQGIARRDLLLNAPAPALASLATVAALLSLFVLRFLDDNRLTSWHWVFAPGDFWRLFGALALAVLLAHAAGAIAWRPAQPALALAAGAFGVSALLWPQPEVIVDAARHFVQAKQVAQYGAGQFLGAWGAQIQAWTDLPLVPLLYGALFGLAGEQRIVVQAANSAMLAGTALLTWQIGRMLWSERIGLAAGALLLGMPYLLVQAPLTLADVPTMFFVTLAACATLGAVRSGGAARMGLAAVAIALAFFTKYSAWLLLTVVPALVLAEALGRGATPWRRAGAVAACALLLVALTLSAMADTVSRQLALLGEFQVPALGRWGESFVSTLLFQLHPFIALAAAASLWLAWRARDRRFAAVAWLPLLLLALGVRRARYLVPMLPMLALMAAYGLDAVRDAALRRHVLRCVVATSLAIVFCGFLPFLQRTSAANLQDAGAYLDTLDGPTVEVVALPQPRARIAPGIAVPLLDLHTGKRLAARETHTPAPPDVALQPLRFTWEYRHPAFYRLGGDAESRVPVAVIADAGDAVLPDWLAQRLAGHRLARRFDASEGVFGYQTQVSVYLPGTARER